MVPVSSFVPGEATLEKPLLTDALQEVDLRTDRAKSTTTGREEATSRKIGSAETYFEEKQIMCPADGKEPWSQRKVRERGAHRESHRHNTSQGHWQGKREWLIFMNFSNQWGSKIGVLEVPRLGWDKNLEGTALLP